MRRLPSNRIEPKNKLFGQACGQLDVLLLNQFKWKFWNQLESQLRYQLGGQLCDQLSGQLSGQIWDQLKESIEL